MRRKCKNIVRIDALNLCYEVSDDYYFNQLQELDFGESLDLNYFLLTRIEGHYYGNVYRISYKEGEQTIDFGCLQFSLAGGDRESNTHHNGLYKVWIKVANKMLYRVDIHYLDFIATNLGLTPHNITSLDLCLDTPFNVAKVIKKNVRDKSVTTILNRKRIVDRDADRPEITYTSSGSLNKDKYLTVCIKQRNAMRDKSKGVTVISYDKKAEIENSSGKNYILDFYGNPKNLFRTEVHLNNEDIRAYLDSQRIEFNYMMLFDPAFLEDLFFHYIGTVIRFQCRERPVGWPHILGRS